jgi:hypothetical protein
VVGSDVSLWPQTKTGTVGLAANLILSSGPGQVREANCHLARGEREEKPGK